MAQREFSVAYNCPERSAPTAQSRSDQAMDDFRRDSDVWRYLSLYSRHAGCVEPRTRQRMNLSLLTRDESARNGFPTMASGDVGVLNTGSPVKK